MWACDTKVHQGGIWGVKVADPCHYRQIRWVCARLGLCVSARSVSGLYIGARSPGFKSVHYFLRPLHWLKPCGCARWSWFPPETEVVEFVEMLQI